MSSHNFNLAAINTLMAKHWKATFNDATAADMEIRYGSAPHIIKCHRAILTTMSELVRDMAQDFDSERLVVDLCGAKYSDNAILATIESMYGVNKTFNMAHNSVALAIECLDFADYLHSVSATKHFIDELRNYDQDMTADHILSGFRLAIRLKNAELTDVFTHVIIDQLNRFSRDLIPQLHRAGINIVGLLGPFITVSEEFMIRYRIGQNKEYRAQFEKFLDTIRWNYICGQELEQITRLKYMVKRPALSNLIYCLCSHIRSCVAGRITIVDL